MEELNIQEPLENLKQDENILIQEIYEHGGHKARQKGKYSCTFCSSSDALSIYKNAKGEYNYKCFSCGETGDVISLIKTTEGKSFIETLKYLCDKYNIQLDLGEPVKTTRAVKDKVVDYFNKKAEKAIKEGDMTEAIRASSEADRQSKISYYFQFPYLDAKNNPLKIWENVDALLDANNIKPTYNTITKTVEVQGVDDGDFESQVMDIYSLCIKYGLKISLDLLAKSVRRSATKNTFNPVAEYLNKCEFIFDGIGGYIDKVCDCIVTADDYDQDLKNMIVRKWLWNTAYIAYNEGDKNTEGCLVLQGPQGCGKTSFIKTIIPPQFLKTGLDLNPDNKDSIMKALKYWVIELGELDATMKADQAKLKAFITESIDEYRVPYALASKQHPRTTSLFGTVNKKDFLKDETGSRRFWIIPIESIKLDELRQLDIDQLWGEVMNELPNNLDKLKLNQDELYQLAMNNEDFNVQGLTEIAVETGFAWDSDKDNWIFLQQSEIARQLGLITTSGLKIALERQGAVYKRKKVNGKYLRGFIVPPLIAKF